MSYATSVANPTGLLPRLQDEDPDIRYMALNDLFELLNATGASVLAHDAPASNRVADGLVSSLKDKSGEVQNMAMNCLTPFVQKVQDTAILKSLIEKIAQLHYAEGVDLAVPALALRAVVIALPRPVPNTPRSKPVQEASATVSRGLLPQILGLSTQGISSAKPPSMLKRDLATGTDSNVVDVVIEVAKRFGSILQEGEVYALVRYLMQLLRSDKPSVVFKKKMIVGLSALVQYLSDKVAIHVIGQVVEYLRDDALALSKRKVFLMLLGSLAKSIPSVFSQSIEGVTPVILSALSQEHIDRDVAHMEETEEERDPESDEVRDAALTTLEHLLTSCPEELEPYADQCLEIIVRFLKYCPNLAYEDDDDINEDVDDDLDLEEDFEQEAGADDDDDLSWKVRRGAAKLARTFIATRGREDLVGPKKLYTKLAPVLVSSFKEREETVRLEILAALSLLVQLTAGQPSTLYASSVPTSSLGRMDPPPLPKRRRVGSDVSMVDTEANFASRYEALQKPSGSLDGSVKLLEQLSPDIVRGVAGLLVSAQPNQQATKQAALVLARDLIAALRDRLVGFLDQIVDPVVDAVKSPDNKNVTTGNAAAVNAYRTEALHLLGTIADTHTPQKLERHFATIIPALVVTVQEKFGKISAAALDCIGAYVGALTPPRAEPAVPNAAYIAVLFTAVSNTVSGYDADTEVRQLAIYTLGQILSSTSGTQLLSAEARANGLQLLASRLKNEVTRLAVAHAIASIAIAAQDPKEFPPGWTRDVSLELGAQLRKASRSLRGSSLAALKAIFVGAASQESIDNATVAEMLPLILPLLNTGDLHLLGPALRILAAFVEKDARNVVSSEFISAVCQPMYLPLGDSTLEAMLHLVRVVGKLGVGGPLMAKLLKEISLAANPDLVGKVVGNLLVSGGPTVGVKVDDFINETVTSRDAERKCLALSVLGETGLLMGDQSPLSPELFISHFDDKIAKVRLTAAVALGRAGSGRIQAYLPPILSLMERSGQAPEQQYLLLHAVREIVDHEGAKSDIVPYAGSLWKNLIAASLAEDNKVIGAECIGKLAVIDPKTYLPQLQAFLTDSNATVRGMVISALRYTFADPKEPYDDNLRAVVVDMLKAMLKEEDRENRRLALRTIGAAAQNRPELVHQHLDYLSQLIMQETVLRPELVREIQMGPFKHKVDDGLELRKSAYECVYALLESAFPLLQIGPLYDRVIAGLGDEHDIRMLCSLILTKLINLAPVETAARLDLLVEPFRTVLSVKTKDSAVKQEVERVAEDNRDVVKVSVMLARRWAEESSETSRPWGAYCEWMRKEFPQLVKHAEEEGRDKER
ncbi:cullin-associated NEDD8-dissociated protein-like protein [Trichodelitschia bisporula]|uniref:Cullin-associated NEDD8-dissociated protein-like protein n=1 Tax=Trichodelitschia bisporula TaxID=703511 RepID=A0A6G1HLD7_9PEZI|nr:cullin-associated NEDD8-dissociated protein-like protein [Trichodelitschia bisporula]